MYICKSSIEMCMQHNLTTTEKYFSNLQFAVFSFNLLFYCLVRLYYEFYTEVTKTVDFLFKNTGQQLNKIH